MISPPLLTERDWWETWFRCMDAMDRATSQLDIARARRWMERGDSPYSAAAELLTNGMAAP